MGENCSDESEETGDPNHPTAYYCLAQGTSMAGPHVAGLAALVISRYGDLDNPQNGKMRPSQGEQFVTQTADPQTADPQARPETLPDSNVLPGLNYGVIVGTERRSPGVPGQRRPHVLVRPGSDRRVRRGDQRQVERLT